MLVRVVGVVIMRDPFEDFDKQWAMDEIVKLPCFRRMPKRRAVRYLEQLSHMSADAVEREYVRLNNQRSSFLGRCAAVVTHALAM